MTLTPNKPSAAALSTATGWMREGVKQHYTFVRNIRQARAAAVNAGFFFADARDCFQDGEWGQFVGEYLMSLREEDKISPRSIQFYMQLSTEALEWAKKAHPTLNPAKARDLEKLKQQAAIIVMQSPKPLVALCRELGEMRKFGEYDEIKYAAQKRLANGGAQLELQFDKVFTWLEPLRHLGEANCTIVAPAGKSQRECLTELDALLGSIRTKVSAQLREVIDA